MLPYNATDLLHAMRASHGFQLDFSQPEPKRPARRWFRRLNLRG